MISYSHHGNHTQRWSYDMPSGDTCPHCFSDFLKKIKFKNYSSFYQNTSNNFDGEDWKRPDLSISLLALDFSMNFRC